MVMDTLRSDVGFTYCPPNVSLSDFWVHHGISECFLDTVSYSLMTVFLLLFGCIQYVVYRRYATSLVRRLLPISLLYKFQIMISVLMPLLAIFRLIVSLLILKNSLQGYVILAVLCNVIIWPLSLMLVLLERHKALPSIPTWGHGLVLLLFWTMAFIKENLALMNLRNRSWWFDNKTVSDKIEMGFFVARYVCSMFLFLAGIRAPGIPTARDYFIYTRQEIEGELTEPLLGSEVQHSNQSRSAFANFWKKCIRLLPFVWPKKSFRLQLQVIICFCLLAAGRVINLFVPIFYKKIVNSLTPISQQPLEFKWQYILIYSSFYFMQGQGTSSLLTNLRSYLWISIQQYTVKELQVDFYSHLLNLSLRWHLGRKTGEVLRILDRGTDSITSLLSYILFNIFPAIADILIAVIYLSINFSGWFGLIVFLTMFLYLAGTVAITEWRTKFRREMNERDNATRAQSVDALLNYETVKYYNAEDYEIDNYQTCITNYQESEWKTMASLSLLNMTQSFVITMGIVSGTLLCAHMIVYENTLTVGDYVLFSTYLSQLYTPLGFFGTYYRMIQRSFIDMENLFDMFIEKAEVMDKPNACNLTNVQGKVEFCNVTFWYTPEKPILTNISFVIPPGKTYALVGHSGSGKSTLLRLLFRFYDVKWGSILIDGLNITDVTQKSLRKHIGVVPQDTVLFNRDVRYNIRYGNIGASDEQVEEAAKAANVHDQILTFPSGYDTVVGERGLKLSGGEKQRVAIARTILKDPKIIFLDEATSSLDSQTERNIQDALNKICANRTTIIIAHRLSTVINADQILVLKDGEIKERGTHEELLELDGLYKGMWTQQIQKDAKETGETNK